MTLSLTWQFLLLLEECELTAGNDLSLSTSIEMFTLINREETAAFLSGDLRDYELLRRMSFAYHEFVETLQRWSTPHCLVEYTSLSCPEH